MKEISAIIDAYRLARDRNEHVALATVAHVEGSSYRKPGARMLVTEKGGITGAISGGCLEGDALRKALGAIVRRANKLVTYDTTDEDVTFGVQLGCEGIVHILFEWIDFGDPSNPVELLAEALNRRQATVMCTLFSIDASKLQIGTALFSTGNEVVSRLQNADPLIRRLSEDAAQALKEKTSSLRRYVINETEYSGFIELMQPPVALVVVGAGNDAMPVVIAAKNLGWHVTVADGRSSHATQSRFPQADRLLIGDPAAILQKVDIDQRTAFVLMTHNYNFDLAILEQLMHRNFSYVGCLGPQKKLQRMLKEIEACTGMAIAEEYLTRIYGPVGLDIGAEAAEEVALSIIAEVSAVIGQRSGGSLKERKGAIHDRFDGGNLIPVIDGALLQKERKTTAEPFNCSIELNIKQS